MRGAATSTWQSELVNVSLGKSAIKSANTDCPELRRVEVSSVYSHSLAALGNNGFPVRHAAANIAPHELQCFAAPGVCGCRPNFNSYFDFGLLEIRPKCSIAAADRTIAIGQSPGSTRNLDLHRPAMTACFQHTDITTKCLTRYQPRDESEPQVKKQCRVRFRFSGSSNAIAANAPQYPKPSPPICSSLFRFAQPL